MLRDRDFSGLVVSSHNQSGHDAWSYPDVDRAGPCSTGSPFNTATPEFVGYVPPIFEPGTDGYSDSDITIQGARAYNPTIKAWTAPDAYAGEVHDPMSQKPYMWNRNNSFDYEDPAGFNPGDPYLSLDAAAKAAIRYIFPKTAKNHVEYGGLIYKQPDGKYSFTDPTKGDAYSVQVTANTPRGTRAGLYHSHADSQGAQPENFSKQDKEVAEKVQVTFLPRNSVWDN